MLLLITRLKKYFTSYFSADEISAEWSYIIFDFMKESKLLDPPVPARIVEEYGLRFVGYERAPSISSVLDC